MADFDVTYPGGGGGGGGGGSPTGPAGGDLSGTYPNPTVPLLHQNANTIAGFDSSGNLYSTPWGVDPNGQVTANFTGTLPLTSVTSLQAFPAISTPLSGGYEGIIISADLSSTMAFTSSFNAENTFDAGFNCSGGVNIYNDQSIFNSAAIAADYTSFSAFPAIAGSVTGYSGFTAGPNITSTALTGLNGFNWSAQFGSPYTNSGGTIGYSDSSSMHTGTSSSYYSSLQLSPAFDSGSTVGNVQGISISPSMSGAINSYTGIQINGTSSAPLTGNAQGITINLSGVTDSNPQGVTGISSDSRLNINAETTLRAAQGFQIGNRVESLLHVPPGSPVTGTDSLGNDFAGDLSAEDNIALGPLGLGWASVGFIADMAVASGKTVDAVDVFVPAVALLDPGYPTGGTVTNMTMVRTFAPVPEGGTVTISHLYGFKIDQAIAGPFSAASADAWGFYTDDDALKSRLYGPLQLSSNVSYLPSYAPSELPLTTRGFFANSDAINSATNALVIGSTDTATDSFTTYVISGSGSNTSIGATKDTGAVGMLSGQITDVTSSANSGSVLLQSGPNSGTGGSGQISVSSGQVTTGISGSVAFLTGVATTGDSGGVAFQTGSTTGGNSGPMNLITGGGSVNSGNIHLEIGGATGTRGVIQFVDGSEGTAGYVWTSTDTVGSGTWMPSGGGGGANTALSNLATTSINADLVPGSTGTLNLGSATSSWNNAFSEQFVVSSGSASRAQWALNGTTPSGLSVGANLSGVANLALGIYTQTENSASGRVAIESGISHNGTSGQVYLRSGDSDSSGNSGSVFLRSGDVTGGGNAGDILLQVGDSDGTRGSVKFLGRLKSSQATAPTTTTDANAGTGATSSVGGVDTDTAGQVSLTIGTAAVAGSQVAINFVGTYDFAPKVQLTPSNANAGANLVGVYATSTTTGFTVNFVTPGIATSTYTWNYFIMDL